MFSMYGALARGTLIALLSLVAVGLPACGGDGDGDSETPQVSDISTGEIAVVGDREIREAELQRQIDAVRRGQSGNREVSDEIVRQQAMTTLLQQVALEQEARRRGVRVAMSDVRKRLATAKTQFEDPGSYRRFLGGRREADLLFQLRLQALTEKVAADARANGENPQRSVRHAQRIWTKRTVCRERYMAPGCGNASP